MLEYIGDIFHHFVDPKKRVFLGYIALSIAIALFWLVFFKKKGLNIKKTLEEFFFKLKESKSKVKVVSGDEGHKNPQMYKRLIIGLINMLVNFLKSYLCIAVDVNESVIKNSLLKTKNIRKSLTVEHCSLND